MIHRIKRLIKSFFEKKVAYGFKSPSARISPTAKIYTPENLFMYEHTNIDGGAIIMNTRAKFIMKKYSGAAVGLLVVTGNHLLLPVYWVKDINDKIKTKYDTNHLYDKDVIVEDDVWLASNVTLLSGVTIGRGAIIGAGSVCRTNIPPYAIAMGNPAKVVGFKFSLPDIIEHEKKLYPEEERLPIDLLEKNYKKYFTGRIPEIKQYLKI